MMEYKVQYQEYLSQCEQALKELVPLYLPEHSSTGRAAQYSLLSGGKRVRAVLVLAVCDLLGGDMTAAVQFAAAVEFLHCYSLIHDDLPCMDNDDMRRGKPSCHKAFGEATALLAGDLLLTEAFELISDAKASDAICTRAMKVLSHGAGSSGMIYGQELDLYHESVSANEVQLHEIHKNKTGALIHAAVELGAAAGLATPQEREQLSAYAFALGLVFQIVDDVLDETSSAEELGKPIGSDRENGKTTFVTLHGIEGAMQLATQINQKACAALASAFGDKSMFLQALAENLLVRKN